MEKKRSGKKEFVWYSLRISFFVILGLWILFSLIEVINPQYEPGLLMGIVSLIWVASTIFNFVISIIHLNKYSNKAFAIVSLVLSSLLMLLFLIGIFMGLAGVI